MKKIVAILAVVSISSLYAGPYEEAYPQARRYRSYQADSTKSNQVSQPIRSQTQNAAPTQYASPSIPQNSVSDQTITSNISSSLNSNMYGGGFRDVKFKVVNGNVRLTGSVDTLEYKSKVESIVKRVDGVREVDNQITVTP